MLRLGVVVGSLLLGGLALGCASGTGVNNRGTDGGGTDGARSDGGGSDGGACTPACLANEVCSGGVCVPSGTDLDHDGVDASVDCDDMSATVGRMAERTCSSSCGTGVERCTDGVWAACTAPTTCNCTPGEPPRMIPCAMCGMQMQVCDGGLWRDSGTCTGTGVCSMGTMDVGGTCGNCGHQSRTCQADCTWGAWACAGEGVCVAGTTDMGSQMCGTCGTGTQTRTRTCDTATCQWSAWTDWSTCAGGGSGVCTPGQTDTDTQPCGRCNSGTHTRTRTCDVASGCNWGAWGAFGACTGESGCVPGDTRTGCDLDSSGNPTPCGVQTCTASCTWGTACTLAPGAQCMSSRGTDFQCCTPSGGGAGWQFCSATSCRWFACAAHSC
jgi:hypothetical protein